MMSLTNCFVFIGEFADVEMLSIGRIKDCVNNPRFAHSRCVGVAARSGVGSGARCSDL
jgi:hypothetical protein